jgi:histone acetyltransferase (RNA polymerase elongator complex component)
MKWRTRQNQTPPPRDQGPVHSGGAIAHRRAEASLREQQAHQPEVQRVADSLRQLRERNHFAAQIRLIFQGGPTT